MLFAVWPESLVVIMGSLVAIALIMSVTVCYVCRRATAAVSPHPQRSNDHVRVGVLVEMQPTLPTAAVAAIVPVPANVTSGNNARM